MSVRRAHSARSAQKFTNQLKRNASLNKSRVRSDTKSVRSLRSLSSRYDSKQDTQSLPGRRKISQSQRASPSDPLARNNFARNSRTQKHANALLQGLMETGSLEMDPQLLSIQERKKRLCNIGIVKCCEKPSSLRSREYGKGEI